MVVIQYDALLKDRGVVVHGVNPGCELFSLVVPLFFLMAWFL